MCISEDLVYASDKDLACVLQIWYAYHINIWNVHKGLKDTEENAFLAQSKPLSVSNNCSNTMHSLYTKTSRYVWQYVLINFKVLSHFNSLEGFKQSLVLSLSLTLGCEVGCRNIPTLTAVWPGWMTSSEVSGGSLPLSVSDHITSSLSFVCVWVQSHFAVMIIFLIFLTLVPSPSSKPVGNRPPAQEVKQTSQKSASVSESQRPRSNQALVKNIDCHGGSQVQGYWM